MRHTPKQCPTQRASAPALRRKPPQRRRPACRAAQDEPQSLFDGLDGEVDIDAEEEEEGNDTPFTVETEKRWDIPDDGLRDAWRAKTFEFGPKTYNRLIRGMSGDHEVTAICIDGTDMVREAQARHGLSLTATAALGRALMGAALLWSFRHEDESLQVTFQGNGILKGIQVIAAGGYVKGKVGNPLADLPLREDGKLDVGGVVGQGTVSVVRTQPMSPQPYTGVAELETGEIAEDLTRYLADSEQTNSALALGVKLDTATGKVITAGGYLIQVLPFASSEVLDELEHNVTTMPPVSELLAKGMSLEELLGSVLHGCDLDTQDGAHEKIMYYGPCEKQALQIVRTCEQGRMKKAVAALGEEEVERIVREEGKIEVTCQFCNDTFNFDDVEIEEARHFARVQAEFDKQEEAEEAARFERDLAEVQGMTATQYSDWLHARDAEAAANECKFEDDVLGPMKITAEELEEWGYSRREIEAWGYENGVPTRAEVLERLHDGVVREASEDTPHKPVEHMRAAKERVRVGSFRQGTTRWRRDFNWDDFLERPDCVHVPGEPMFVSARVGPGEPVVPDEHIKAIHEDEEYEADEIELDGEHWEDELGSDEEWDSEEEEMYPSSDEEAEPHSAEAADGAASVEAGADRAGSAGEGASEAAGQRYLVLKGGDEWDGYDSEGNPEQKEEEEEEYDPLAPGVGLIDYRKVVQLDPKQLDAWLQETVEDVGEDFDFDAYAEEYRKMLPKDPPVPSV